MAPGKARRAPSSPCAPPPASRRPTRDGPISGAASRGAGLTPRPPPPGGGGRKSGRRHLYEGRGDRGGTVGLKAVAAHFSEGRAVHRLCVTPKFEFKAALLEGGLIHTAVCGVR